MNTTVTLPVGLSLDGETAHTCVWAPNAKAVAICGTFNDWNRTSHPLKADPDRHGHWHAFDLPIKADDEYQFAITDIAPYGAQIFAVCQPKE